MNEDDKNKTIEKVNWQVTGTTLTIRRTTDAYGHTTYECELDDQFIGYVIQRTDVWEAYQPDHSNVGAAPTKGTAADILIERAFFLR